MQFPPHATSPFLRGGEMGALMSSIDWSRTLLGAVEQWPASLRTTVQVVLANPLPMMLWWGPGLVQLYNDAFRPMLGDRHPRSMGQVGETAWGELWVRL